MEINTINEYGSFGRRFVAFLIDRVILWFLLCVVFFSSVDIDMWNIENLFSKETLGIEIIMLIYFVYFEALSPYKATLGKKIMGLKVVSENYQNEAVGQAVIRFFTKYLSMFIFGLGFISIIFNDKKQGWHDKVAGTLVIKN